MRHPALTGCGCLLALALAAGLGFFLGLGLRGLTLLVPEFELVAPALRTPLALVCALGVLAANVLWLAKGVSFPRLVLGNALLLLTTIVALTLTGQLTH